MLCALTHPPLCICICDAISDFHCIVYVVFSYSAPALITTVLTIVADGTLTDLTPKVVVVTSFVRLVYTVNANVLVTSSRTLKWV